ncbi:MAG: chromosomal replication initiator protein DnaA [Clostridia bacterium]|nr:chromosomal replication initiator protein DnaA [Clostridia bacterium]
MDSFKSLFDEVKKEIQKSLSEAVYNVWFEELEFVSFDGTAVTLSIGEFKRKIIEQKFMQLLNDSFVKVAGFDVEIKFLDNENKSQKTQQTQFNDQTEDKESTFDTFVVGPSNKFAHAAALAVSVNPGAVSEYNPLFIWGNSGLGKTHLLKSIASEIKKNSPETNILSTHGEAITNELIECIQKGKMNQFHDKYRTVDVLLVDDIQFIAGKVQTEEEFFHTFNSLHNAGKQIVLTSDRPPKDMPTLADRLRTRFEWGLIADIQPPDLETRMAIINRKAENMGLDIPNEVVLFVAEKIRSNIRQLEGAVKKIGAYINIFGSSTVTINIAQNAIKDIFNDNNQSPEVLTKKIIEEVARSFSIEAGEITSKRQYAAATNARQVSMYIISEMTGLPAKKIGESFNGRDHSTVLYSISKVRDEMKKNSSLKNTVEDIIKNVRQNG